MKWTLGQIEGASRRGYAAAPEMKGLLTVDAVAEIMTCAVELVAQVGGAMDGLTFERWRFFATELRGGAADLANAILAHATAQGKTVATLQEENERMKALLGTFDKRCADALADEVAVLVQRRIIDARSPAADALLDYRNPPSSPRTDQLATLQAKVEELEATNRRLEDERNAAETSAGDAEGVARGVRIEVERLKAQVERLQIDISGHVGTIREQHDHVIKLQEQVARLTAAGTVLSEHTDRTAGEPLGDAP
jgi:chromosome segregation ATPase